MRRWQYETVAYLRNRAQGDPAIEGASGQMSDIDKHACRHLDWFLKDAGSRGWELASTLVPFAAGKELADVDEADASKSTTYLLKDALDVQWLIFKREV
jgi:hypothetical protein